MSNFNFLLNLKFNLVFKGHINVLIEFIKLLLGEIKSCSFVTLAKPGHTRPYFSPFFPTVEEKCCKILHSQTAKCTQSPQRRFLEGSGDENRRNWRGDAALSAQTKEPGLAPRSLFRPPQALVTYSCTYIQSHKIHIHIKEINP